MRRNRKNKNGNSTKKERAIMIASSAFVLAALTMTGVYMKFNGSESENDGYSLDLAEFENSAEEKANEIAQNVIQQEDTAEKNSGALIGNNKNIDDDSLAKGGHADDALDFMPLEIGSGLVEIPEVENRDDTAVADAEISSEQDEVAKVNSATVTNSLQFAESQGLLRPVSGEVLLPFSMDGSIYFSTLDQYKYNPALMLSAEVGSDVLACAEARVINVFENEEIGRAVTFELGNGYEITYGQLENVSVYVGDYVEEGEAFATVAAPTKYFVVEGSNLYLKLTAEGVPVDPEILFR